MSIITFGRIGSKKNLENDKKIYFNNMKYILYQLSDAKITYERMEKMNELEFDELLNKEIKISKKNQSDHLNGRIDILMGRMGLSYIILDKKEKEKIRDMEFTYENWKNKSLNH